MDRIRENTLTKKKLRSRVIDASAMLFVGIVLAPTVVAVAGVLWTGMIVSLAAHEVVKGQ
jgi:hypothetical protein